MLNVKKQEMANDKYKSLILITINNTLHIKADNLEPVEVDSSCVDEIRELAYIKYFEDELTYQHKFSFHLKQGINISELSDRIELREETTHHKSDVVKTYKAFLLPEKEDNFPNIASALRKGINPMYTIEEIEKAIDEMLLPMSFKERLKIAVINNLKK